MPSCTLCGEKAVMSSSYLQAYLCREHFIEYFEKRVKLTINILGLIRPGERVAVAVSGGKDSLTALYLLSKFSKDMEYEVFGLAIDEGIKGYSDLRIKCLKDHARNIGVELYIVSFKEFFGASLDEIVKLLKEKGFEYKPCSVCGVFRRYIMNKFARELKADKLATGHNLDDEIQVFLMNAIRGAIPNIVREGAITEYSTHKKMVPRIKPLYFIPEKESLIYSKLVGLNVFLEAKCPYVIHSMRHPVRRWLNKMEWERPLTKYRIMATKEVIASMLGKVETKRSIGTCEVCGEPSSTAICKACFYKNYLFGK